MSADYTDTPEYQAFVESQVKYCRCCASHRPCDGVLAGGMCDNIQPERDELPPDDEDLSADPFPHTSDRQELPF